MNWNVYNVDLDTLGNLDIKIEMSDYPWDEHTICVPRETVDHVLRMLGLIK